jgi:hypothetical protein
MTSKNDNDALTRTARVLKLHETPTTKSYDHVKLTIPVDMLLFDSYDAKSIDFTNTEKLYLVAPLGRGGNGDVWFAIAADPDDAEALSNKCCAIKYFFKRKDDPRSGREIAYQECEHWNTIYGDKVGLPKCHVGLTYDSAYLCMPYLQDLPKRLWGVLLADGGAEEALIRFTQSGYKQESMRWEHFRLFENQLYLVDLGRISKFGPKDDFGVGARVGPMPPKRPSGTRTVQP